MREPGGVAGGAAKERGTTPSKPKKVNVTPHRGSCEGQTPSSYHEFNNSTDLDYPPDKRTRREAIIAEQSGPKMDAGKENPTKAEGPGGGTRLPVPDYPAGGDSAESNADPKRVKTATDQWPDIWHNFHLRVDEALQKAEEWRMG